jgi:muramoyltetrapeptide carboxypeptidase
MANAFNEDGFKNEFVQSVMACTPGKEIKYQCKKHEFNRKGEG